MRACVCMCVCVWLLSSPVQYSGHPVELQRHFSISGPSQPNLFPVRHHCKWAFNSTHDKISQAPFSSVLPWTLTKHPTLFCYTVLTIMLLRLRIARLRVREQISMSQTCLYNFFYYHSVSQICLLAFLVQSPARSLWTATARRSI